MDIFFSNRTIMYNWWVFYGMLQYRRAHDRMRSRSSILGCHFGLCGGVTFPALHSFARCLFSFTSWFSWKTSMFLRRSWLGECFPNHWKWLLSPRIFFPQNSQKIPRNVSWEISGVFHLFQPKKNLPFSSEKNRPISGTFESIDADLKEGAASVDEQEAANRHSDFFHRFGRMKNGRWWVAWKVKSIVFQGSLRCGTVFRTCPQSAASNYSDRKHDQKPQKVAEEGQIPLFQGNLGLWNIIWPEAY